jgi:hypothetical protein
VRRAEAAEEGATLFTDQASWNLPGANVSLNDAARMQHERDMQERDHAQEAVKLAMQIRKQGQ